MSQIVSKCLLNLYLGLSPKVFIYNIRCSEDKVLLQRSLSDCCLALKCLRRPNMFKPDGSTYNDENRRKDTQSEYIQIESVCLGT